MARSMVNQGLILGTEATPGIAVAGGRRVLGIRATPGFNVEREGWRPSGYKVDTSDIDQTDMGEVSIDTVQDFNAMTYIFTGGLGKPVSETPSGATLARQHVYSLNPRDPDPKVSFTARWGDTARSLIMRHFQFNGLDLGVSRNDISIGTAALSYTPEIAGPLPTVGVTEVESIPLSAKKWACYIDDSWDDLGTTKATSLYNGDLAIGDKYVPDWVVNDSLPSFSETLEAEDTDYTGSLTVGFDATAEALIGSFTAKERKFIRFQNTGRLIETGQSYMVQIDLSVVIISPGEIGTPSGSPAVILPFDYSLQYDATSGKVMQVTLVNTCPAL